MYTPAHFAEEDPSVVLGLVRSAGFGHLVCQTDDGLASTPLPFVVDDGLRSVRCHLARANPMWKAAQSAGQAVQTGPERAALLIVAVADAYVSPGWYPSKADHGKVVPTWNYEVVHLHGTVEVHDESDWVGNQIADLTNHNEASMRAPWAVSDAPDEFIAKQQRAIVGLELTITRIEAKRKLSQNRSNTDHEGVVSGLRRDTTTGGPIADAMVDDEAGSAR